MPDHGSFTSKSAGITLGILLLLTFVIPFGLQPDNKPIWSWDVLKNFELLPKEAKVFYIGVWAIGLLALVLGAALRRLALATCYLILGIGGVVIVFAILKTLPAEILTLSFASKTLRDISPKTLQVIWLIATGALLIVCGIRGRLGGVIGLCIFQILIGAAFTAFQGILLHDGIRAAVDAPPGLPAGVWWPYIFRLIMQGLLCLGGLFAFFHGFGFRSRGRGLTTAARVLVYIALLGGLAYPLVDRPVHMKSFAPFLFLLNPTLMLACLLLLFLEGCIAFFSELGATVCQPIAPPAPAVPVMQPAPMMAAPAAPTVVVTAPSPPPAPATPTVQGRLQQLDAMLRQGAITEEEYNTQRARILDQL